MAKATIQDIPQVFLKNPKLLEKLRSEFGRFYDQENKPIRIYDSQLQKFNEIIHSPEINIDPKLTPKELGIKFEEWFELLSNIQTTTTEIPQYEEQTTTTGLDLETKVEQAEKRDQQNKDIRTREKQAVEDFTKNGKSIYEEQKKNQEQIKKAQEIQTELKNKTLYAQIVLTKEQILSKQEETDLNTLREIANLNQDSRAKLVNDLSEKIVEKIRPVMTGATDEEIITVSRSVAVDITEKISTPESRYEIPTQIAILNNLPQAPETGSIIRKPLVIQELEKGSIVLAQHKKSVLETNESITKSLLGNNIAKVLYGDSPIQVIFTDKFIPNKTTHTIQLEGVNQDNLNMMRLQDSFLTTLREKGIDHIREVGIGQTRTFINNQFEKAINKLPKESALRTIYSSETVNLILNRKQLVQQPIFMNTGNIIGSVALRVAPKYAPILTAIGGGSYAAVAASSYAASYVTIQTTAGIFAAEAFAGGAGGALAGASAGSIVPIVGTAIGAVVGYIGGEVLSKVASRIKVWWTENKDQAGPAIAVGLGFGGLILGGPAAGGITLGLGLAATGSLAAFATGAFGVLGLIGRSVGIAIATPVIITLLVLPPLVAFIMLVINNSAYVVPPGPPSSESGSGSVGLPGVACTEEKLPTSITFSVDSPIATRAWEIVEDLYQGFWCYWNRSPGDLDTDITTYPESYPELFDMDEYRNNPNPTRGAASSCGECMFWCTWLVQKAYKESGYNLQYTLWSPAMYDDFNSRDKIIDERDMTIDNIKMGAVIFFDVKNSENRIDHVAIVYSVSSAGVKFVQSNSGTKDDFIPFGTDGILQNPSYATIKGVGNP